MSLHEKWILITKDADQSYPSETQNVLDKTNYKDASDVSIANWVSVLGSSNKSLKLSGA